MRGRRIARLATVAAGVAGILGAHVLDYLIVIPNGAHRHELLLQTGHGYWPHAAAIGLVAGVLAALASFGAGFASEKGVSSFLGDAGILALVQVGAFVALEGVERIGSGRGAMLLFGPLLVVGMLMQIVVAIAIAAILRCLVVAGSSVAKRVLRDARRRATPVASFVEDIAINRSIPRGSISRRGPPLLAAS